VLAVTLSRRTGAAIAGAVVAWALRHTLPGSCRVYVPGSSFSRALPASGPSAAGGGGDVPAGGGQAATDADENPYMKLLWGADVLAVTADSVTMASEACAISRRGQGGGGGSGSSGSGSSEGEAERWQRGQGARVFVIGGHRCTGKLKRFHEILSAFAGTRPAPGSPVYRAEESGVRAPAAAREGGRVAETSEGVGPVEEGSGGAAGQGAGRAALDQGPAPGRALDDAKRVAAMLLPPILDRAR